MRRASSRAPGRFWNIAQVAKLSVCLLTFNSARLLEACLTPLMRVADELVVVDSGSSDATLDILARNRITPVKRSYVSHSDQMNYASSIARHEWVLCIDSDEILDEATVANVLALKPRLDDARKAYRISRQWFALGRPVHAVYPASSPDYPVRLFHRGTVQFNGAPVDDKPIGFAETEIIAGEVRHDTFYSLHEVFQKLNVYTTRLCELKQIRPSLLRALVHPLPAVFKWYVVKDGWRDGKVGVVMAVYAGLYTFMKYFKAWYFAHERARPRPPER